MKSIPNSMKRGFIAAIIIGVLTINLFSFVSAAVPGAATPNIGNLIVSPGSWSCFITPGCYCKANPTTPLCQCKVASGVSLGCCTSPNSILCTSQEKKAIDDQNQQNRIGSNFAECKADMNSDACKAKLSSIAECKDNPLSDVCKAKMKEIEAAGGAEQGAPTESNNGLTDAEIAANAAADRLAKAGQTQEQCSALASSGGDSEKCCSVYAELQACKDVADAQRKNLAEKSWDRIKSSGLYKSLFGGGAEGGAGIGTSINNGILGGWDWITTKLKTGAMEACKLYDFAGCGVKVAESAAPPEAEAGTRVCLTPDSKPDSKGACPEDSIQATGSYMMTLSGDNTQIAFNGIPGTGIAKITSCMPAEDLHFKLAVTNALTGAIKITCTGAASDYDRACGVLYQCDGSGTINKLKTFGSGTVEILSCVPSFKRVDCSYQPNADEAWAISKLSTKPQCVTGGFFENSMSIPACQRFTPQWTLRKG